MNDSIISIICTIITVSATVFNVLINRDGLKLSKRKDKRDMLTHSPRLRVLNVKYYPKKKVEPDDKTDISQHERLVYNHTSTNNLSINDYIPVREIDPLLLDKIFMHRNSAYIDTFNDKNCIVFNLIKKNYERSRAKDIVYDHGSNKITFKNSGTKINEAYISKVIIEYNGQNEHQNSGRVVLMVI